MNGFAGSSRPKKQKQGLTGSSGAVPTSKTESGDPVVGLAVRIVESAAPISVTGKLTRFRIPLKSDAPLTRKVLVETPIELPRINYETRAGKRYRYLWVLAPRSKGISSIAS
jgi:carotenoid cleavage dioxygenase-like enzyme